MTTEGKQHITLPWLVAGATLLLYVITVNPWVSLLNLSTVARTSGWFWQPEVATPLTLALLWPFRALPTAWIPIALNLFTALCAALVLALLVRCTTLLPFDVAPPKPGSKERPLSLLTGSSAWMPATLAAMLLAFQLSFWEHATSASGEMVDLLLFAYIVRCLLEFRVDQEQRWLSRSALLYGIGIVNNWAMIGFLPVYLAALLRLKGLGAFLSPRFLLRMTGWALLGLSLYLLLPALHLTHDQWGFWTTLKTHLKLQKDAVSALRSRSFRTLAIVSLLPLLVLSIRWKSHTVQFGDDTRVGVFLTKAMVHFLHACFLVATLWIALDPAFAPRHLRLGTPALTFYFGASLVFGYCAGYFLLLGSQGGPVWLRKTAHASVAALLAVVPLLLVSKNLPCILVTNGRALHDFARQLASDLPAGKSTAISDEPVQLLLLQAELTARHDKEVILLETASLSAPEYHRFMAARTGARWPLGTPTNTLAVPFSKQVQLVVTLASREPTFYLHPSSGRFFEFLNAQPHGLLQQLSTNAPTKDLQAINGNEALWQTRWTQSLKLLSDQTTRALSARRRGSFFSDLGSVPEKNAIQSLLAAQYSRSLNQWGVVLQRNDRWPEAGVWFQRASELEPQNVMARINSEFNTRHQKGDTARLKPADAQAAVKEVLFRHANWREALRAEGPVDEPMLALRTGRILLAGDNNRQAAREFLRAAELEPHWAAPRLWLAQALIELGQFERALEQIDAAQALGEPPVAEGLAQTLLCRATALSGLGRTNEANAFVESFIGKHAGVAEVLATACDFYEQSKQFDRQISLLVGLLQQKPGETGLLLKKGQAELELHQYPEAIATLTKVLLLAPGNDQARLYRAVAYLSGGQLDLARADYEQLLQKRAQMQNALFGLGAIAWRQNDTNAAIEFYRRYLSNGTPRSAQYEVASERLKVLTQ